MAKRKNPSGCGGQSNWSYWKLALLTKVSISIQNRVVQSLVCLRYEPSHETYTGSINGPIANSLKFARIRGFLQPSIWLRCDYYVQLVAIKRNWMPYKNLREAGREQSCRILIHLRWHCGSPSSTLIFLICSQLLWWPALRNNDTRKHNFKPTRSPKTLRQNSHNGRVSNHLVCAGPCRLQYERFAYTTRLER